MANLKIPLTLFALALLASQARAQPAPANNEAATAMVGTWEISNSDRDKRCTVTFSVDPVARGLKLELEAICGAALPMLKDVVAWALGQNDVLRFVARFDVHSGIRDEPRAQRRLICTRRRRRECDGAHEGAASRAIRP